MSFVEDFNARTPHGCARPGCQNRGELTPVIEMLPPKSSGYKGDPMTLRYGLAICQSCRPWFIETSGPLVAQAEELGRIAGKWVDSKRTRVVLIPLPTEAKS